MRRKRDDSLVKVEAIGVGNDLTGQREVVLSRKPLRSLETILQTNRPFFSGRGRRGRGAEWAQEQQKRHQVHGDQRYQQFPTGQRLHAGLKRWQVVKWPLL